MNVLQSGALGGTTCWLAIALAARWCAQHGAEIIDGALWILIGFPAFYTAGYWLLGG